MFGMFKSLELPPQLEWRFSDEPELLAWTIRARKDNTFLLNCAFVLLSAMAVCLSMVAYSSYEELSRLWRSIIAVATYLIPMSLFYFNFTHARINCAFRLTKSGIEYCKWKDFPEWTLSVLKWLAVITAIIFLGIAVFQPAFLIAALAGPGGMALMHLKIANSESYRELHSEYNHGIFVWEEITQLAIATNREIVDLKYHTKLKKGSVVDFWNFNIFCKRKQKEAVAALIRPYLAPSTPFIRVKLDMLMSTDTHTPIYVGQCGDTESQ